MESPGEYLKREREHRGVELKAVFEATRIPLKLLEAIETDNLEAQHPTFLKGFIRSYCKHLGLDENDAVLRYEIFIKEHPGGLDIVLSEDGNETGGAAGTQAGGGEQGSNSRRNVAILVVLGVVVIILFSVLSPILRERNRSEQSLPALSPNSESVTEVPPGALHEAATETAATASGKVLTDKTGTARPVAVVGAQSSGTAPVLKANLREAASAESLVAEFSNHILTIKATEEVWVETWVDGGKPVDVILKAGESLERRASDGVYVVIGNAGGVEINFDGELMELFGQSGKVVRLKLPAGYEFDVPPPVLKRLKPVPVSGSKPPSLPVVSGGAEAKDVDAGNE
jgi:cytoskeletal protein RodZ